MHANRRLQCVKIRVQSHMRKSSSIYHYLCHSGESEITLVGCATRLALVVHLPGAVPRMPRAPRSGRTAFSLAVLARKNLRHSTHIRGVLHQRVFRLGPHRVVFRLVVPRRRLFARSLILIRWSFPPWPFPLGGGAKIFEALKCFPKRAVIDDRIDLAQNLVPVAGDWWTVAVSGLGCGTDSTGSWLGCRGFTFRRQFGPR
jgi:hypothetical protein